MKDKTGTIVDRIISAMLGEIAKYELEVLLRYPNDILVHDRAALERFAVPGAKIGWMVGHSHSHFVPLGLHRDENTVVECLCNLCSDDRFYLLSIDRKGDFLLQELSRDLFSALSSTETHYHADRLDRSCFWLLRGREDAQIGYLAFRSIGQQERHKIEAIVTPIQGISELDRSALHLWCSRGIVRFAGTMFVPAVVEWAPPQKLSLAA